MKRTLSGAVIVLALLLSSCGVETGPSLTFGLERHPESLDPAAVAPDSEAALVAAQVVEPLFQFLPTELGVVPWLVEENLEVTDDGLIYTFFLRNNVRFHDGGLLDADAVVFSLNRALESWPAESPPGEPAFPGVVDSVTAVDPRTVRVTLKEPYSPLLKYLALPSCGIVSPAAVESQGEGFGAAPVGTGPYRVVRNDPETGILLQRWNGYWYSSTELPPDFQPVLGEIVFRAAGPGMERARSVGKDSLDAAVVSTPDSLEVAGRAAGARVEKAGGTSVTALVLNTTDPPLNDVTVRRAIAHAVDKAELVNRFYPGSATPAAVVLPPKVWGHLGRPERYPFDPEKARSLLVEAGHAEGFETTLAVPADPPGILGNVEAVADFLRAGLAEAGVKVTIERFDNTGGGLTPGMRLEVLNTPSGDADPLLARFCGKPRSGRGVVNPVGDHLLRMVRATRTVEGRRRYYAELDAFVYENVPAVFLAHPSRMVVVRDTVRVFPVHPTGAHKLAAVRLQ